MRVGKPFTPWESHSCLNNHSISPFDHKLNMELDLQSLFGLLCTAVLIGRDPATPPLPPLGSYTRALLVSQDRRHLFVTSCCRSIIQRQSIIASELRKMLKIIQYLTDTSFLPISSLSFNYSSRSHLNLHTVGTRYFFHESFNLIIKFFSVKPLLHVSIFFQVKMLTSNDLTVQ